MELGYIKVEILEHWEVLIVIYQNITSGNEDGMMRNVFLLVSFTILCLEGIYFFMMPGGGSNKGDGSSASASSEVLTPVAVEVSSLQPFQVKGDPHSRRERFNCKCLVKGSQTIRRNMACYFTQLGLTYRKFISHWCLMVQRRTTPKLLRYWMIILFQKLMHLLKVICLM